MKSKNTLLEFIGGAAMLTVGLYLLSSRVTVSGTWFGSMRIFGSDMNSGVLLVPFIIGIVWMFASEGSLGSKLLTAVGVLIILASIIANTHFYLQPTSLAVWIIILVLTFGGLGLVLKVLFSNSKDDKDK